MIKVGQVFVLSSMALIFIFGIGLILTSTLNNIAKNENIENDKTTINHGIDAMRTQEWWYDKFKVDQLKALNMRGDLIEVRGVKTLIMLGAVDHDI